MSISGIFSIVILFSIRLSCQFLTPSVQNCRDLRLFGNLRTCEKLKRTHAGRKALLRALTTQVLRHGRIITTVNKAKQTKPRVERIIKYSKYENKRHAFYLINRYLYDRKLVQNVIDMAPERFKERHGGYCRIKRLNFCNRGNNANRAILELLEY